MHTRMEEKWEGSDCREDDGRSFWAKVNHSYQAVKVRLRLAWKGWIPEARRRAMKRER